MNLPIERPLSELYTADITRLRRLEIDAIIALHRMNVTAHRLTAETKPSRKIYE
jgi:hypothetical protein